MVEVTGNDAGDGQGCISCGILVSGIRARGVKFGAHGEHGDVFLFSNLGAL